jgi:hypothetical protein
MSKVDDSDRKLQVQTVWQQNLSRSRIDTLMIVGNLSRGRNRQPTMSLCRRRLKAEMILVMWFTVAKFESPRLTTSLLERGRCPA